jgi:hypothetical protein
VSLFDGNLCGVAKTFQELLKKAMELHPDKAENTLAKTISKMEKDGVISNQSGLYFLSEETKRKTEKENEQEEFPF